MSFSITATVKRTASQSVHAARDALAKAAAESDRKLSVNDLYGMPVCVGEMESAVPSASNKLAERMKKAGLKPVSDEVSFGIHGGHDGPVTFWYQRQFAGE